MSVTQSRQGSILQDGDILYEDNHLLVVNKRAGMLVQGDKSGAPNLLDAGKEYLKSRYNKPGNVFLGLVHRLDRPTSGVIVFARTSKAASRLSRYFRKHRIRKTYLALIEGRISESGHFRDYIRRDPVAGFVTGDTSDKFAELIYRRKKADERFSLVEIDLLTGRHHQIRIQFSHRGHPVAGDRRYGAKSIGPEGHIALHAAQIEIIHPVRREHMTFSAPLPPEWDRFS